MSDSNLVSRWKALAPQLLSVLRITAALLFMEVGSAKLFGIPVAVMPGGGTAPAGSLAWWAGVLEVFGGGLLLLGLFSRPVAFLLSGEMAVAYFKGHFPQAFWPVVNQGAGAILFCFVYLYISAAGPGPWSIDAALRRGRRERSS